MSIFTAIVAILQVFATFVKFGPFSITLALAPIVVGAALYGPKAGAWLGGVFGAVVLAMCIAGADIGGAILWNVNPAVTAALCIAKGAAAGWVAGMMYKALSKKKVTFRVIAAALCGPIVNTGIFCLAMVTLYHETLIQWAAGADLVYYVFIVLIGVNFLLELLVNVVLSPVIARIIKVGGKEIA
jgi:uncharacterized membrane protein